MESDLIFIILNSLTFVVLFFLCAATFLLYQKLTKKQESLESQANKILDQARQDALNIIQQANEKSVNLLGESENLKNSLNGKLNQSISKAVEDLTGFLEKSALIKSDEIKKSLFSQFLISQEQYSLQVKNELDQAKVEIEKYKATQLENIDQKIDQLVSKTVQDLFIKSLKLEDQEEIVLKALEKAKTDQFFLPLSKQKNG